MTPVASAYLRVQRTRVTAGFGLAVLLLSMAVESRPPAVSRDGADGRHETTFMALFSGPLPIASPDLGVRALEDDLVERGYTLAAVRDDGAAVPRLFLNRLPADLPDLDSADSRKDVFVKMLLPLILAENERVLTDRGRLIRLRDSFVAGAPISRFDRVWLEALTDRYDLEFDDDDVAGVLDEMLLRVDVVPASLALGQAALETGWGTSAAARAQAMFGQMVFSGEGERAEVRRFERLAHAVEAYALNLNTHKAYARFRDKRAEMRRRSAAPNGYELALTLGRYSERKMNYVRDVRGIIRANKLQPLDGARLDGRPRLAGG